MVVPRPRTRTAPIHRVAPSRGALHYLRRRRFVYAGLGGALGGRARAQESPGAWPARPVRYVELFGAGGATDIASRLWCQAMAEITGQQFVVENRVGAGGRIGTVAIARAAPDGYTIGLSGGSLLTIAPLLFANLQYDPVRDLTLISGQWRQPLMLVVNNDLPARNVEELVALLRQRPGRIMLGHPGLSTSMHLAMELFKARTNTEFGMVPYGGPQMLTDLMAGRVDMACGLYSGLIPGVRAGQFRALAVTSPARSPGAPDIAALSETVPGFDYEAWSAVVGPAGLAPALVERIHQLSVQALRQPELVQRYRQVGSEPWFAGPAELAAYRAEQEAVMAPVIRAAGLRLE